MQILLTDCCRSCSLLPLNSAMLLSVFARLCGKGPSCKTFSPYCGTAPFSCGDSATLAIRNAFLKFDLSITRLKKSPSSLLHNAYRASAALSRRSRPVCINQAFLWTPHYERALLIDGMLLVYLMYIYRLGGNWGAVIT